MLSQKENQSWHHGKHLKSRHQDVREGSRKTLMGVLRGAVFDHLAHLPQRHPLLHRLDLEEIRLTGIGNKIGKIFSQKQ